MFKNLFNNKDTLKYFLYLITFIIAVAIVFALVQITGGYEFFNTMENRTFDLRQTVLAGSGYNKPNKDIVIIAIDDASYEYLLDNYGEWPVSRDIYAKMVNYLEQQNPTSIAFDLMFVKSLKSKNAADSKLVDVMKKYKNVYTAMNFDDQAYDVRKPVDLPKKLAVNVKNDSKMDTTNITYKNCRAILPQIIESTSNVGLINVTRATDGILRKMPLFVIYKDTYYPHLALKVALNYIKKTDDKKIADKTVDAKNFHIDKGYNVKVGKRSIPIDTDGGAILNWYGPSGATFTEIPFYKVVKAMNGDKSVPKYDFKNKIIYVGTTAVSLYDTKSVPIGQIYPGVEVHVTYLNNIIDNNFIKKVSTGTNLLITLLLAAFIGYIVIKTNSTIVALGSTILTTFGYVIVSYYVMKFFNLWIAIIVPVIAILLVFVASYIVKYLIKSRDFEHQYRLATTDGLTELYNHRYFQEQMIMQVENCKRYNSHFSLILIDIDFFKKFNDTYGHQAGDAVLRQVAQTLKKNVRATDIVCRYGGEEMTIILSNTDKDEAIITAQKICQAVAQKPFKLSMDLEKNVTISLGVSTYPQDGSNPAELIARADQGLYVAKENGRNQVGL